MTRFFHTTTRTLAAAAVAVAVLQSPTASDARATIPNDTRAIVHALNRLAFGARPGEVARVADMTLARWIEQQLQPDRVPDTSLDARLARLTTLDVDPATLGRDFLAARQERRRRQQEAGSSGAPSAPSAGRPSSAPAPAPGTPMAMDPDLVRERQVIADLAEAKLLRAVYSERQLEEVLVDFWFNHFNVFARKGQVGIYLGQYEREAIRPHVLGRFRDLLGATAKSPAMLVYLDNWMSADPDAASRVQRQPPRRGLPRQARGEAAPRAGQRPQARMMRGLNENYARELLELHTLGVDGGYTQQDVVEVARAFTGWTVGRPAEPGFRFAPMMHDRGAKTVLGHGIAAGGGIEDGERVLDLLASHPATARHIALKLAQRLVSDTPPASVVDAAARTFTATQWRPARGRAHHRHRPGVLRARRLSREGENAVRVRRQRAARHRRRDPVGPGGGAVAGGVGHAALPLSATHRLRGNGRDLGVVGGVGQPPQLRARRRGRADARRGAWRNARP